MFNSCFMDIICQLHCHFHSDVYICTQEPRQPQEDQLAGLARQIERASITLAQDQMQTAFIFIYSTRFTLIS